MKKPPGGEPDGLSLRTIAALSLFSAEGSSSSRMACVFAIALQLSSDGLEFGLSLVDVKTDIAH
jgi:hypothetical protein